MHKIFLCYKIKIIPAKYYRKLDKIFILDSVIRLILFQY